MRSDASRTRPSSAPSIARRCYYRPFCATHLRVSLHVSSEARRRHERARECTNRTDRFGAERAAARRTALPERRTASRGQTRAHDEWYIGGVPSGADRERACADRARLRAVVGGDGGGTIDR